MASRKVLSGFKKRNIRVSLLHILIVYESEEETLHIFPFNRLKILQHTQELNKAYASKIVLTGFFFLVCAICSRFII